MHVRCKVKLGRRGWVECKPQCETVQRVHRKRRRGHSVAAGGERRAREREGRWGRAGGRATRQQAGSSRPARTFQPSRPRSAAKRCTRSERAAPAEPSVAERACDGAAPSCVASGLCFGAAARARLGLRPLRVQCAREPAKWCSAAGECVARLGRRQQHGAASAAGGGGAAASAAPEATLLQPHPAQFGRRVR